MDHDRFDALTRVLGDVASRRRMLRGMATAGTGLVLAWRSTAAHSSQKGNRSPGQQKTNVFGCFNVGVACKRAGQCCSGRCEGKKARRKCRAHDTGTCPSGEHPAECLGPNVACVTSQGKPGACGTTTGNAGYCLVVFACAHCTTDADCQSQEPGEFGPLAACIRCAECQETNGTACAAPDQPKTMASSLGS